MFAQVFAEKRPFRNCLRQRDEFSEPNDYAFCGNGIREGPEECDCGLDFISCNDPCCYAAQIDPIDMLRNESAVPCRRGR